MPGTQKWWLSSNKMTVQANTEDGVVVWAAPIVCVQVRRTAIQ